MVISATVASTSKSILEATRLWYMQLRHYEWERVWQFWANEVCLVDKMGELDFCEHYVFKKQCRVKFIAIAHRTKVTLDYIHLDL